MKLIGTVIFAVSLVLLAVGYAASQWARLDGDPDQYKHYAVAVDVFPVKALAAALLIACVIMPFLQRSDEDAGK